MRMYGFAPKPGVRVGELRNDKVIESLCLHVSHRMGNSLCSHPALLMSALGGMVEGQ